jgi:hypothetical protein
VGLVVENPMKRGGLFFGLMSALLVSFTGPALAAEEQPSRTGRWGVLLGARQLLRVTA